MLDGLKDIFLDALIYTPQNERARLINRWNKECENVYEIKESLKAEERYTALKGVKE